MISRNGKAIWTIARREFRSLWQDPRLRTIVFIAPFLYSGLFCWVYSNHTLYDIPIAVYQEDFSAPAQTLVSMLEASPKLKVDFTARSASELKDLIHSGKVEGAILIPKDFSAELKRGNDTYAPALVNASSMVTANLVAKAMNEVVQTFSAGVEVKKLMKTTGMRLDQAKKAFMPVKLDLRTLHNPGFNYTNFMIPGLLFAILQQILLLGVALSWTGEKEKNTLAELRTISPSYWVWLIGKSIPYVLVGFILGEFFLRILFPLNEIPMEGDWFLAIPFTFLFVLSIVTWGMWVSGICRTRLFATQLLMFVAMPSFILSGFTWPQRAMPETLQWISQLLPLTHFVNSFRRIYLEEVPFPYVAGSYLALVVFILLNLLVSHFVFRRVARTVS